MRHLVPILLLGLASCGAFGLSSEEKRTLADHEANAQLYFDRQKFDQAEDQIRKGLAIEPKNYKLNLLEAMILLQRGKADPRRLPEALDQFDKTRTLRPTGKLDSRTHLGVGLCNQRMAQVLKNRALNLRKEAESGALNAEEKKERLTRADAADQQATIYLKDAREALEELIAVGELLTLAHYHLFQVATLEKNLDDAIKHGDQFRAEAARRQAFLAKQLETSFDAAKEVGLREQQRELKAQTVEVLGLLANIVFEKQAPDRAVVYLDELLQLDATRSADYLNRARCLMALKNYTRAKDDVEVFLRQTQLPFESTQVKEALELRRQLERLAAGEKRGSGATPDQKPLGDGR